MSRLLRMLRKKALQVVPESEGSSCHLPREEIGPFIPDGGEGAPSRARRWKCPAFWQRKPAPGAGAEVGEALARPKWSWPRMQLGRQDPAQEGSQAGWLWGLLCQQHQSQEPIPDSQQEASPCLVTEDLPAPQGRRWRIPVPAPAARPTPHGTAAAPGTREAARPMDAIALFQDEAQQLMFLHAIHPACLAAQQRGQDTLHLHCCKAAVVERIVELVEELPDNSPPGAVLTNSLLAVGNLSTMTTFLEPELETHLL
ncbi:uncharacterized protein LOC120399255 [Mauremys reevesii]|uniref:uncharacterized protein LOC120399255 n=1 Tax=Mauremys reevesii TaxID=260615 RepID=UPI00193FD88B|nr:uncharacterized protein LOC120399255 [Mauremys reevesii]